MKKKVEFRSKNIRAIDTQKGGNHYKDLPIQPIEFIVANNLNFCLGNVVKYICRNKENKIEDLKKAIHYLQLELELNHNDKY